MFNLLLITVLNAFFVINCSPVENGSDKNEHVLFVEAPYGKTVTITCRSNTKDFLFLFWHIEESGCIIGPSNENYDENKYEYQILSGNLTIKNISKKEEGLYNCVSRGVKNEFNIKIRSVRMFVRKDWEEVYEHDAGINLFRVVVILGTLMLLGGVGFFAYKIWRNRFRYPHYLAQSDEDDEDDSGEEVFRAPGTSRNAENTNIVLNKPQGFDNPSISTDFSSILDTASNK